MKTRMGIGAVMAVWLLWASALHGQEIRYWGKTPGATKGWVETQPGQYAEVGVGEEIPGWGRVKDVGDDHLIVEWVLSEADKERLRQQGMMAYDVLEIRIPR